MSSAILTARAIIIYDDKLLVVRHSNPHSLHYAFPGGKMEEDESIKDAIIREIREELSVEAKPSDIQAVHEFVHPVFGGRRIEFFMDVSNPEDFARISSAQDNTSSHAHELSEIVWIPLSELQDHDIRPASIRDQIAMWRSHVHHTSE